MADYTSYLADYKETYATYGYTNTTWGDLLTSYNGTSITYDAIGNPTKWRNAAGLTWEARELQRTDLATGAYVDYTYNSDGIRTSRSYLYSGAHYSENRKYSLDGTKIIQEDITISTITALTNATLYYLYDVSGEVQGFIYNNSYYYFQKNLQGDVVRILNSSGTVVTEYTYDAWGKVLTTTGTMASTVGKYNPFRYRSYYYDTETGFYYLQSRYYDPTVGRFINADVYVATGQGIVGNNMYAYCGNNPVIYIDADGENPIIAIPLEKIVEIIVMAICTYFVTETAISASPSDTYVSALVTEISSAIDSYKAKKKKQEIALAREREIERVKTEAQKLDKGWCFLVVLGKNNIPEIVSEPMRIEVAIKLTREDFLASANSFIPEGYRNIGICTPYSTDASRYILGLGYAFENDAGWKKHSPLPHYHTIPHEINVCGTIYDIHAWYFFED